MSINKNMLWSVFFFLFAINMPVYVTAFFPNLLIQIVIILLIYMICTSLVVYIYYQTAQKISLSKVLTSKILLSGIFGMLVGVLFQFFMIWLSHFVIQRTQIPFNMLNQLPISQGNSWLLLIPIVFVPIMEECVFRYSMINFLNQKLPVTFSILISSLLFALMHGEGHILTYTGLGILFYFIYHYSKSLISPIIAHVGMNLVVILFNI